jgi:multidrug efflux pump subunit AcrA (membrane-fusion protein)
MNDPLPSLSQLKRAPATPAGTAPPPGAARRRLAMLLPVAVLAGFAALFLALFRDRLLPAPAVRVAPVVAVASATAPEPGPAQSVDPAPPPAAEPPTVSSARAAGPLLFQASGWIEPDPQPIRVTALRDGVVEAVHTLEGQLVRKGQLLATLVDSDARLELDRAREELRVAEHEAAAHRTGLEVTERKIEAAGQQAAAEEAMLAQGRDQLARLEAVKSGAVSTTDLIEARFAVNRLASLAAAARSRVEELGADLERIRKEVPMKDAQVAAAKVRLDEAQLAFDRTRIHAPLDGRVLRLLAAPGQKKMLGMDDLESATIAILYQPDRLQVRVDVPLADAAGLAVGQPARVRCNLLPDTVFAGEVTRINGEADLQRNTLQAKVRLLAPSDLLRPEMLCRVEFLAPAAPLAAASSARTGAAPAATAPGVVAPPGDLSLFVPEAALAAAGDGTVWVCDRESCRVEARTVRPGGVRRDGFVEVLEGVRPGEWVVLDPAGLRAGQRVKPEPVSLP